VGRRLRPSQPCPGLRISKPPIQRVTRLFHGNRNFVFPIKLSSVVCGNLHHHVRHDRQRGEIFLSHPDELVFLLVADDFNPVIVQQLEFDLDLPATSAQAQEVSWPESSRAFLLHFGFARRANTQLQVRRGDRQPALFASTKRLERIGMVVLRSTTPCVVVSSFNSADFVTLNSMDWLSSRTVPVAVIITRTFLWGRNNTGRYFTRFCVAEKSASHVFLWKCSVLWIVVGDGASRRNPQPQRSNKGSCYFRFFLNAI